jgi:hypothetical protein
MPRAPPGNPSTLPPIHCFSDILYLACSSTHYRRRRGRTRGYKPPRANQAVLATHIITRSILEEYNIKRSKEEGEFWRSLSLGFAGKWSIAVVSGGHRRHRPHQHVPGEFARLLDQLSLPSSHPSFILRFGRSSPPQTSLPELAPVTISRGRCHQ